MRAVIGTCCPCVCAGAAAPMGIVYDDGEDRSEMAAQVWGRMKSRISGMSTGRIIGLMLVVAVVLTVVVELVAADKYRAVVNVTEGGEMGINPLDDALDFGDIPRGAGQTRFVTLANDGDRSAYIVVWTLGGISELITVDRERFVLEGQQTEQVAFKLRVPPSTPVRVFSGAVLIFRLPHIAL